MLRQRELSVEQLSQLSDEGYVFAVVDACVDHELVMDKANRELNESKAINLFKNTYMESYTAAAPYLFSVDRDFFHWIEHLDQSRWGIFVLTKEKREALILHLQHFLMVALPNGSKGYFRYYDPRILKTYVLSCNAAELEQFFGPVRGFAVAEPEEQKTRLFDLSGLPSSPPERWPTYPNGLWPIRQEQFQALGKLSQEHFAKKIVAHLHEFFPHLCELYETEQMRIFILNGIHKAAEYGITTEREVCAYIDLTFVFGKDFEHDAQHEWITIVLKDYSRSATDRIAYVSAMIRKLSGAE